MTAGILAEVRQWRGQAGSSSSGNHYSTSAIKPLTTLAGEEQARGSHLLHPAPSGPVASLARAGADAGGARPTRRCWLSSGHSRALSDHAVTVAACSQVAQEDRAATGCVYGGGGPSGHVLLLPHCFTGMV